MNEAVVAPLIQLLHDPSTFVQVSNYVHTFLVILVVVDFVSNGLCKYNFLVP